MKFSYSLNIQFSGEVHSRDPIAGIGYSVQPCKLNHVVRASQKILLIEEDSDTLDDGGWDSASGLGHNGLSSSVSIRHDKGREMSNGVDRKLGKGNVVFADGHHAFIERRWSQIRSCIDPRYDGGTPFSIE